MARVFTLAILSDIHYASAAEQARGDFYKFHNIGTPLSRWLLKTYHERIWLRRPLRQNHLLDQFLAKAGAPDWVIANGDFTCDSGFVGVSDDAAFDSARECLGKLRAKFGTGFCATLGDHDLGKFSFIGAFGGMRLVSFHRARGELGIEPFWKIELGSYVLLGIASSLVALPVFAPEVLPEELPEWEKLREEHLARIRDAFSRLKPGQRVLLFCHDPTALPFLWRETAVQIKADQIEQTIIGHLHTNLVLWKSHLLAGMPPIRFLGNTARRLSTALHAARHWQHFRVRLCPSLAGVELLRDGGFLTATLDAEAREPARFEWHRIVR